MKVGIAHLGINTNPIVFEELASSLANVMSYYDEGAGDMKQPFLELERLFCRALREPASYREITELAGEAVNTGDRRAGRAAWLLLNIESLRVLSVHSLIWHKVKDRYYAPLLQQVQRATGQQSKLTEDDLQELGKTPPTLPVDVLGVKDNNIWIVQTLSCEKMIDSAVVPNLPASRRLVRGEVFEEPVLEGRRRTTLKSARYLLQKAFPSLEVLSFVLVMHPKHPDFELYHADSINGERLVLKSGRIRKNSLDFKEQLREDQESLWTLPQRLDNELFIGLPPCRAGRTLGMLASAATRQLKAEELLTWKERQFTEMLAQDYGYDITRDKIRHDLCDRLVLQGFLRKRGSNHFLTHKGMARYQYCLAKYTTRETGDAMAILNTCTVQRNKIVERYGCL